MHNHVAFDGSKPLSGEELIRIFEEWTIREGGLRAAARRMKLTPQHLNAILKGRKKPGPAALKAIGYAKVTNYVNQKKVKR